MITKRLKKSKSFQTIFFQVLFSFFAIGLLFFLVISNLKINKRRSGLTAQIESLEKEIQILEQKNEELKIGIEQSGSESYLEKEARERLGLKKLGEEVVVIKELESEEEQKEIEEKKTLWDRFLEKLIFWRD